MTTLGGRWKIYDENGNITGEWIGEKQVLKYVEAENRWCFEMWCPPENYGTPEEWDASFTEWIDGQTVHTLGPFPRHGEYELIKILQTPKGYFVPLTEAICEAAVSTAKLNRELPGRIKVEAGQARRDREEKARISKQNDILDNYKRVFGGEEFVVVPGSKETRSPGGIILP